MTRHHIISDLHLGMGRLDDNNWHSLEDFKSDDFFRSYLDRVAADADELIINGDWIDFHQLEPYAFPEQYLRSETGHRLGWTEEDSLSKFENCRAARAHKGFFDDLRHFLRNAAAKLTVIMGNHDPDLFWPRMMEEVRNLLCPRRQEQLEFVQTFTRRGTAHIEHGNQYCSPENRFSNPSDVFHRCTTDGKLRLEMVWGTVFVMEFFNSIEQEFPYAGSLKTQSHAIWWGIKNGWIGGDIAAKFVKFLSGAGVPWSSITANMLAGGKRQPSEELIKGVDTGIYQDLIALYDGNPHFRQKFDEEIALTPAEEWIGITSSNRPELSIDMLTPLVDEASTTLGIFRDQPEFRGALKLLKQSGVKQVIFGHTHAELDGSRDDAKVKNYFNTGSWVNSLDLSKKETRERVTKLTREDLKNDGLFELRLMSSIVEVEEDNSTFVSLVQLNR
jgi:UDP-2,3-diacylglucosamine pyrophosphatase LpxH